MVQKRISGTNPVFSNEFFEINEETIKKIKATHENDNTRVISLIKSIETIADDNSDDPFLIGLKERAEIVEENYENRQISTQKALEEIQSLYQADIRRRKEQAERGYDGLTFFVYQSLIDKGINDSDKVTEQIKNEFVNHPNWKTSEKELRELRQTVYFALLKVEDDIDKVAGIVDELFNSLFIVYKL